MEYPEAWCGEAAEVDLTTSQGMLITGVILALAAGACAVPGVGSSPPAISESGDAGGSGVVLPPAWTETPTPTVAPSTMTPTPTPPYGLDWATPVPVDSDYAGWVRLESKRASLWLPPGYEAADLGEFGDLMALMAFAMTETMGQMAGEMAAAIASPIPGRPTPTLISLEELQQTFLFDLVLAGNEADEAALFLVGEPPKAGTDLGTAMDGALSSFTGEVKIESRHAVRDRPYPMARLVVASVDAESGRAGRHLLYVLVIDDRAWSMNFAAPAEAFDRLLPQLEKSAASFELRG